MFNQLSEDLSRKIDKLDLSNVVKSYQKNANVDAGEALYHADLYRDFLRVLATRSADKVVPEIRIDAFWHEHMKSEGYERDMNQTLGCKPIHDSSFYRTTAWDDAWLTTRGLFLGICHYDIGVVLDEAKPAICGGGM